jgi:glutathione synthase/RimK-type ligase-like ATP-grasp enzyme
MHTSNQPPNSLAIFCTTLELNNEPFSSEYYWRGYQDLLLALKDRGIQAYFTTDNQSYLGNGRFKTAYTADIKTLPDKLKRISDVQVDLVFDRAEHDAFAGRDITVINSATLRKIANNKIEMYRHFSHLQALSVVVGSRTELERAFETVPGKNIVAKEPEGSGGRAVHIGSKSKILAQVPDDRYPLLVQEFLDTSMGVPGHKPGIHDIRISVCGGNIIGYYIRVAKPGAYHSNVSQGGKMVFLPIDTVPAAVEAMVREIDNKFAPGPRYYAADFAFSDQGWKMIELNPYLALLPASDSDEASYTLNRLADYLVEVCIACAPAAAGALTSSY